METAILSFDRQKSSLEVYELSSKGATDFLDSTDTVNNFALHFKGTGYMKIHWTAQQAYPQEAFLLWKEPIGSHFESC